VSDKRDDYDAEALRGDIARIRERLKRLDSERLSAVEQLEKEMVEAEKALAERAERNERRGQEQPPPAA
jgi:hypothetical protein